MSGTHFYGDGCPGGHYGVFPETAPSLAGGWCDCGSPTDPGEETCPACAGGCPDCGDPHAGCGCAPQAAEPPPPPLVTIDTRGLL